MKADLPESADDDALNPYQVTAGEPTPAETNSGTPRIDVSALLYVTAAGAILGSVFLAPYVATVGDPGGSSIEAELGGRAGLFLALSVYVLFRWRRTVAAATRGSDVGPPASQDRTRRRFLMFVAARLLLFVSWCGIPAYLYWNPDADFLIAGAWALVNLLLIRLWNLAFSRWAEPVIESQGTADDSPVSHPSAETDR